MKVAGIVCITIGLFLGYSQFSKLIEINSFEKNTIVVEGTVVEVESNLEESKHWKNDEVKLMVEYAYSPDSVGREAVYCLHHSKNEYDYLSCTEVGTKKMVRFVPSEKRNQSSEPDFIQVTDTGDYYSSTFAWYLLLLPFPFLLVGFVLFWIGRKIK